MSPRAARVIAAAGCVVAVAGCTGGDPDPAPSARPTTAVEPADDDCHLGEPSPWCAAWSLDEPVEAVTAGPGLVAVVAGREVVARSLDDGSEVWRATPADAAAVPTGIQVVPAGVLMTSLPGDDFALATTELLDGATGGVVWSAPGYASRPSADGAVVAVVHEGTASVRDSASGEELWTRPMEDPFGPAFDDGHALVGGPDGVALVDDRTGAVRWEVAGVRPMLTFRGSGHGSPLADELVTGLQGDDAVLLDRATGEITATGLDGSDLPGYLDVLAGVVLSVGEGHVARLGSDGAPVWTRPGRVVPVLDGNALVVAEDTGGQESVALLDPATGTPTWQVRADVDDLTAVADDQVVALVRTGSITLLDRSTGEELGRLRGRNPQVVSLDPFLVRSDDGLAAITR